MRRVITFSTTAAFLICAGLAAGASTQAPSKGSSSLAGCGISGTANLRPGLSSTMRPLHYAFSGTLSNCQSSDRMLRSGAVHAVGKGTASCADGKTVGTAVVRWNDGRRSVIAYRTSGATNDDTLTGAVTNSTEPAFARGATVKGDLAFTSFKGSCATSHGVTQADFRGGTSSSS